MKKLYTFLVIATISALTACGSKEPKLLETKELQSEGLSMTISYYSNGLKKFEVAVEGGAELYEIVSDNDLQFTTSDTVDFRSEGIVVAGDSVFGSTIDRLLRQKDELEFKLQEAEKYLANLPTGSRNAFVSEKAYVEWGITQLEMIIEHAKKGSFAKAKGLYGVALEMEQRATPVAR